MERASLKDIVAALEAGMSQRDISRTLRCGRHRVSRIARGLGKPVSKKKKKNRKQVRPAPKSQSDSYAEGDREATATMTSSEPLSKGDLAKKFKIDLTKWECVDIRVKCWEAGRAHKQTDLYFDEGRMSGTVVDDGQIHKQDMYTTTARFALRKDRNDEKLAENFRQLLGFPIPAKAARKPVRTSDDILEIALPDVHHGLRTYADDTGVPYNLDISTNVVRYVTDVLLDGVGQLAKIIVPIGHDWLNSDNAKATTTAGTPQDEDDHWFVTFKAATASAIDVIRRCKEHADEVEVLLIPGNHDGERSYYLAECLRYAFEHDPSVVIDAGISPIKVRLHHDTLVEYHHGDRVKPADLAATLPGRWPQEWAKSRWREVHMGHIHLEREEDIGGIRIRHFRCISANSNWAGSKCYNNTLRAGTSIRYRKGMGPFEVRYANI